MILSGDKVILRPTTIEDVPILFSWFRADPFLSGVWSSVEDMERVYGQASGQDHWQDFVIETREDLPIGNASLRRIDWQNRNAQVSMLVDRAYRDLDFSLDAAYTLVCYAFDELALHRLWGTVLASKTKLIRACERYGAKQDAVLRETVLRDGRYHDMVVLSLLNGEWVVR